MTARRPLLVAILTGQSDPRRWALSPEQERFLDGLSLPEEATVRLNFPYLPDSPPHCETPLLRASRNNIVCYFASRRIPVADQAGVIRLLERAERTVFLTGSCGLELYNNLKQSPEEAARTEVFAYGPFARRRPSCRHVLVQGRRDWVSRRRFREVDHLIDCGHLDYLSHPDTLRLCREFIGST
jgi:hypothetical protein